MKLVSYTFKKKQASYRIGCVIDNKVIDLHESYRMYLSFKQDFDSISFIDRLLPADPATFFLMGDRAIARAKKAYAFIMDKPEKTSVMFHLAEVTLGIPNPSPTKIICVGRNYADHATEMDSDIPEYPVLFSKFTNALIGPEDAIQKSSLTNELDYEVELTVVIGKNASRVNREDADDYIAGYTIGNDITARDLQKRTPQWLQGKTLDKSTPVGPWVVTADEIGDPANLSIRSFVNEEMRQASNTSKLIFDIPFLIEYISRLITLHPGDIILTGTPDGVGAAMNPPGFLQVGDLVTSEIEKIGKLTNRVVEQQ